MIPSGPIAEANAAVHSTSIDQEELKPWKEQKAIAVELQKLYAEHAPAVPLFPGPEWGEYNTMRFEGFPDEENPYALLSTYSNEALLVFTTVTAKPEE